MTLAVKKGCKTPATNQPSEDLKDYEIDGLNSNTGAARGNFHWG